MKKVGSVSVNVKPLHAALERLGDGVAGALGEAALVGGLVVEGEAKQNIIRFDFIDTGATLNSTAAEVVEATDDGAESQIGPATEYAIFGELGLGGQSEKPFMREAIGNTRAIEQAVADTLRAAIKRAVR